jgi:hypothetical protein
MKGLSALETDLGESTRCGRCAEILPDETMTFCPACGVPFSTVPPTNSFHLRSDGRSQRNHQTRVVKVWITSSVFAVAFWLLFVFAQGLLSHLQIANLESGLRPLEIYTYNFANLDALSKTAQRKALSYALQSFEDHFGLPLRRVTYFEDSLPQDFEPLFRQTQTLFEDNHFDPWAVPFSKLSFWESSVFPQLSRDQSIDPRQPLKVVITNFPIRAFASEQSQIETRHLSRNGLISGLGHPGLVMISTYKAIPTVSLDDADKLDLQNDEDRARFLGEFVLAHELGHALMALSDEVVEPFQYRPMRSPASNPVDQCLMTTDSGGGRSAWQSLKSRALGKPSTCSSYEDITQAVRLRNQSVVYLKSGLRADAEKLHLEALKLLSKNQPNSWLVRQWLDEHKLFVSAHRRLLWSPPVLE